MRDDPIFVAGLERTGTSLMYALLASHSQLSMTRRTNFWRYFNDQYGDLADDANLSRCLDKLRVYKRMQAIEVDFDAVRTEFVAGPRTYARLFAVIEEQVAARRGKPRWGDKSLDTERWTEQILANYPRATVLHMLRDPRDRLASVVARWKERREALGVGTARWIHSAELAARHAAAYPDNYLVVRYEDLVRDPHAVLRSVCAAIGEPFEEGMLGMHGAEAFRDQGANSSYGARPVGVISADSVGTYGRVLTPRQIVFVDRAAAEPMARFGYDRDTGITLGLADRVASQLLDRPRGAAGMLGWSVRTAWNDRRGQDLPDYRIVEAGR